MLQPECRFAYGHFLLSPGLENRLPANDRRKELGKIQRLCSVWMFFGEGSDNPVSEGLPKVSELTGNQFIAPNADSFHFENIRVQLFT
jgi:hypothetical protein